jgi:hypothetical protein
MTFTELAVGHGAWGVRPSFLVLAGLGEAHGECNIISDKTNRGDGLVICNMTDREAYEARGYEVGLLLHGMFTEV